MSVRVEGTHIQGTTSATPLFQGLGLGTASLSSPMSLSQSQFFQYTPPPHPRLYSASPAKRPRSSPSPSPPHPIKKAHLGQTADDSFTTAPQRTLSLPSTPHIEFSVPWSSLPSNSQQHQDYDSPLPLFALPPSQSGLFRLPGRLNAGSKSIFRKSVREQETRMAEPDSANPSSQSSPHSNLSLPLPRQIPQTPPTSYQQLPVQDSSPSQSSMHQQTSPGRRPWFFGRDANVPDDDPFAPLPDGIYDGYEGRPTLGYYDILDDVADEEFFGGVGKRIADFMDEHYTSFTVLLSHVGYTRHSAAPAILVIGKTMQLEHAAIIGAIFLNFQCTRIREVFCYDGDNSRAASDDWDYDYHYAPEMRQYSEHPDSGSSIGRVGSNSSCTLGVYLRLHDDSSIYSLTVHHGVSTDQTPISPSMAPGVKISQPSYRDHRDNLDDLEQTLANATASDGMRKPRRSPKSLQKEIQGLQNELQRLNVVDTEYAEVAWSEIGIVRYKDADVNADWALLKVKEERVGRNYALKSMGLIAQKDRLRWIPRDLFGVYFRGIENLATNMEVSKTGRRTGSTQGKVLHRYAFVKLDTPTYTTEYVIVTQCNRPRFSDLGDSGSAVFDTSGYVCGMVLGDCNDAGTIMTGLEHLGRVCVSYITPMPLILERIKVVTGKEAELIKVDLGSVTSIVAGSEADENEEDDDGEMYGATDGGGENPVFGGSGKESEKVADYNVKGVDMGGREESLF